MYCVYKLTDKNGLVYYGSTENPDERLKHHKYGEHSCSNNLDKDSMEMNIIVRSITTRRRALWVERHQIEHNECVNFNKPILDTREGELIRKKAKEAKEEKKKLKNETVAEKKLRIIELNRKQQIAISKKGKKILTKDGHILV